MEVAATVTLRDKEMALLYEGRWVDAIQTGDVQLLRALIGLRGAQKLKQQVGERALLFTPLATIATINM